MKQIGYEPTFEQSNEMELNQKNREFQFENNVFEADFDEIIDDCLTFPPSQDFTENEFDFLPSQNEFLNFQL
jgi:hypothetical protein